MNDVKEKVKNWYNGKFPQEVDAFGNYIDEILTFEDIYNCFMEEKVYNQRVEDVLDCFSFDSDVRYRILEETERKYNLKEKEIFNIYNKYMNDLIEMDI